MSAALGKSTSFKYGFILKFNKKKCRLQEQERILAYVI